MLTDKELEALTEPIIELYRSIETELLVEIARRFANYDEISGSLEWQLKKLNELGELNANAVKIFAKHSGKAEETIKEMLKKAAIGNFNLDDLKETENQKLMDIKLDKLLEDENIANVIKNSYKSLDSTFKMIKTKALESANKNYMGILDQSYLEVSSGIYSYDESIKRGIKKMTDKGITVATYKRKNGAIVQYNIEACVRRDTLTAVNQTASATVMATLDDLGTDYVEVSSHLGARVSDDPIANHAEWQGKVYKVNGSDEKYKNLVEATGYGSIEGLAGVNCRHRMFPFFVGISQPTQIRYDSEENKKQYELEQGQRKLEREVRKAKKEYECMKSADNKEGMKEAKEKRKKAIDKLIDYCDKNNLRRNPSRERIVLAENDINVYGLTFKEKQALLNYISSDSYKINEVLRKGLELTSEQQELCKNLDSALKKIPTYRGSVSRSIDFRTEHEADDFVKSISDGKAFAFKQFVSTKKGNKLYNPQALVQIGIKEAAKGHDISFINKAEAEVLYGEKNEFKLVEKAKVGNTWYIILEED